MKKFRNFIRQKKASKSTIEFIDTHLTFSTSQKEKTSQQQKKKKKPSLFNEQNSSNRKCLCDFKHSFDVCYYLMSARRSENWTVNSDIQEKVDETMKNQTTKHRVNQSIKSWKNQT